MKEEDFEGVIELATAALHDRGFPLKEPEVRLCVVAVAATASRVMNTVSMMIGHEVVLSCDERGEFSVIQAANDDCPFPTDGAIEA